MSILLVRHGHAGRRSAYKGDDRTRPLSKRGAAQARALVPLLTAHRPQRILSSPYVRCYTTVQPTAEVLGLPVESIEELAEGHGEETIRLMERMAGEAAVLCTHGDVAQAVLEALGGSNAGESPLRRLQKGDVWVIQSTGSRLAIVDHLRPQPAETSREG
jgi:8-oxo-(d)GTP phosphatase